MQKIELNVIQLNCMGWRDEQIGWHGSSEDKGGIARGNHADAAESLVALHGMVPLASSTCCPMIKFTYDKESGKGYKSVRVCPQNSDASWDVEN